MKKRSKDILNVVAEKEQDQVTIWKRRQCLKFLRKNKSTIKNPITS